MFVREGRVKTLLLELRSHRSVVEILEKISVSDKTMAKTKKTEEIKIKEWLGEAYNASGQIKQKC